MKKCIYGHIWITNKTFMYKYNTEIVKRYMIPCSQFPFSLYREFLRFCSALTPCGTLETSSLLRAQSLATVSKLTDRQVNSRSVSHCLWQSFKLKALESLSICGKKRSGKSRYWHVGESGRVNIMLETALELINESNWIWGPVKISIIKIYIVIG